AVPPARRWRRVFGVPAALAVVLLALPSCGPRPRDGHYAARSLVLRPSPGDGSSLTLARWTDSSGRRHEQDTGIGLAAANDR
ncbi:MAG TPA: hypothetical protein VD963_05245, partial [Phycisphaerales bacterium]|nr:hypothetical protein [Phycisphaerales bacterium]